jgi:signal peptidase I
VGGRRKRKGLPLWQELPLLLIIAFCLAVLIRTFLLQAFYIPSGSMEDTLTAGDRVLVNKVVYNFREPARGEVVVFRGTDAWAPQPTGDDDIGMFATIGRALGDLIGISRPGEKDYIKRVIGLPGDTLSCCDVDGRVFVNGQPLDEEYVVRDSPLEGGSEGAQDCRSRRFDEVVVQPGQMFVMGDHRQVSQDSRCQGLVPIENIIGRAFVIVWPSDRWGGLPAPETFAGVPEPAFGAAAGPTAGSEAGQTGSARFAPGVVLLLLPVRTVAARCRFAGRGPGRRLAE